DRYQARGQSRNADAGGDRGDEAVYTAAHACAAIWHVGAVQGPAHLGARDARRRVDDQRQWPGQVEFRCGRAHPDEAVPLDELATFLAGGPLADEHVELVALQALMQQAALVDREVEV